MRERSLVTNEQIARQTPAEQEQLRTIFRSLAGRSQSKSRVCLIINEDGESTELSVPSSLENLIVDIADALSKGDGLAVVPLAENLTTSQAANLLGVSRQYLQRLLDKGVIPFHMVGAHHRVKARDVLAYKRLCENIRDQALTDILRIGEELQDSE